MGNSLQFSKSHPWLFFQKPWKYLQNVIDYLWSGNDLGLGKTKIKNDGVSKKNNKKNVDERYLVSQAILDAIELSKKTGDTENIKNLVIFCVSEILIPSSKEKSFSVNHFISSKLEVIRFARYISKEKKRGLRLACLVNLWLDNKVIRGFKKRRGKVHFRKYGESVERLLERHFVDEYEYSNEAINIVYNPKTSRMMYYYRGKKPSLGYFLEKDGKFLWVATKDSRIVAFRVLEKSELRNNRVFSSLYRVY